jgi:segregation and condensation protein B
MDIVDSLHALLFVADSPAAVSQLAAALGTTEGQAEQALEVLRSRLESNGPIQVIQLAGGYQLCTKPEYQAVIAQLLQPFRSRISRSQLEVLAIVAYRQPITTGEIDQIRGVQSDHSVRALVERRMIQDIGRRPTPGRPVLYATTQQFLHAFNMNDLSQLPALEGNQEPEGTHFEI